MIEAFQAMFSATLEILKIKFTLYGFTLSMWDVFLWCFIAGIILWFVGGLFFHD